MNPVTILRSSWAATGALILLLWAQIPHPQYVFEHLVADGPSGWTFAIGFELAVLMLVVRNMHAWAWLFAGLSVLINVAYYQLHGSAMWLHPFAHWSQWLFAILPPLGIAMYSHIMTDAEHVAKEAQVPQFLLVAWEWTQTQTRNLLPAQGDLHIAIEDSKPAQTLQPQPRKDIASMSLDELRAWAQNMRNGGKTLDDIAAQVGKSTTWVSRNTEPVAA